MVIKWDLPSGKHDDVYTMMPAIICGLPSIPVLNDVFETISYMFLTTDLNMFELTELNYVFSR